MTHPTFASDEEAQAARDLVRDKPFVEVEELAERAVAGGKIWICAWIAIGTTETKPAKPNAPDPFGLPLLEQSTPATGE